MNIISSDHENSRIVTVCENRIDAAVAIRFKEAVRAQTAGGPDHIILDLTQVDFIDSSGLGAIVATMKQLGPDRRLDLAGLTPAVDKVFQLTRMDSVFRLFKTLQSALDACAT
jgi:anti-sigma B factor antagonist